MVYDCIFLMINIIILIHIHKCLCHICHDLNGYGCFMLEGPTTSFKNLPLFKYGKISAPKWIMTIINHILLNRECMNQYWYQ